jgi:hypothetical protein
MRVSRIVLTILFAGVLCLSGKEEAKSEEKKKPLELQKPIAFLDLKNSSDGSYPGGVTPLSGRWSIDAGAKNLKIAPEPLVRGRLEFGPEIREKGATIQAVARGPSSGRLKSRYGVGLYGKNGFQLRVALGTKQIELVRRGIVLTKKEFTCEPETLYQIELSVIEAGNDWQVSGRVWDAGKKRPKKVMISHKILTAELLFPLAGRPAVIGTPFSGESIQFASARVFNGEFVDVEEAQEMVDGESEGDSKD